jgi:hypothetical protein
MKIPDSKLSVIVVLDGIEKDKTPILVGERFGKMYLTVFDSNAKLYINEVVIYSENHNFI